MKRTLAAVAVLFVAGGAAAQVFDATQIRPGDLVSGSIQYGQRRVVLPEGQWRLVVKSERNSSRDLNGIPLGDFAFDEVVDGTLTRLFRVRVTKFEKQTNWLDEPCKDKKDAYWMDDRQESIASQFCTRVGFLNGVVDDARGGDFMAWAQKIAADKVAYTPDMPAVSVVRYTNLGYMYAEMAFNPARLGVPASPRRERHLNLWNPKVAQSEPKVIALYEALKSWAPVFAQAVKRDFEGDTTLRPEAFGAPDWPKP